jgi:hypothetical protein
MGLYNEMEISPEAKAKAKAQAGGANYAVASSYRTHQGAVVPQGDGFIRDVEKEKTKEEKEKEDDNRKEIEKEKREREKEKEAQQNFFSEMAKEQPFLEEGKMRQEEPEMRQSRAPQIDIQTSLPNLPNIWQEFDFSPQELPKAQDGLTFRTVYTQNPNDPRIRAFEDSLTDYLSTVGMERVIRSNKPTDRAFQDALKANYQRGYSFRRNSTTNAVSGETNYFDFPRPVEKVVYREEKREPNINTDLSFYLKTIGMDNSKEARKKLFDEYIGGEDYKGSATQNITLLQTIKKSLEDKEKGEVAEKDVVENIPQKERDTLPDLTAQEQPTSVSESITNNPEDRYAYRTQWVRGEDGRNVPRQVPYAVQYGGKGKYVMLENVEPGYKKASSTIPTKQVGGVFNLADRLWLNNWYKNRVIPDEYIQEGYEMDKPYFEDLSSSVPEPERVNFIAKNVQGRYNSKDGSIKIVKDADKDTYLHEATHRTQDFPSVMRTVHSNVVKDTIVDKDSVKDKNIRDNYEYFSDPDEVHARVMVFRKNAGLKPDEEVTPKRIESYLKKYKGDIPNINELLEIVGKDKGRLATLLNLMADSGEAQQDLQVAEYGGLFGGVEVDPMGMYNGKRPVIVPSNDITMEGVNFPVLGVSDEGDTKVMQPGKKYKFKGKNVLEIPLK